MIFIGHSLVAIAYILGGLVQLLTLLIIARVIISWLDASPYNMLVKIIIQTTDPLMNIFGKRRFVYGMMDFTPIIVLVALMFIGQAIVPSLVDYGNEMVNSAKSPAPAILLEQQHYNQI